ncbi:MULTISPECIES: hypothetical protein, partial [unclassified Pseudomonas]|uniref:hypothetical protein n=1 Tax=unclassified Pseudomonas TaxID=196821 RepID=UPI001A9E32CC
YIQYRSRLTRRFREQARSHSGFVFFRDFAHAANPAGVSLLAMAWAQATTVLNVPTKLFSAPTTRPTCRN